MSREQRSKGRSSQNEEKRDSGMPGGGQGRRDEVGQSGVYPVSNSAGASPDARIHDQMSWGQGERGAEGYFDSGSSELYTYDKEKKEKKETGRTAASGKRSSD